MSEKSGSSVDTCKEPRYIRAIEFLRIGFTLAHSQEIPIAQKPGQYSKSIPMRLESSLMRGVFLATLGTSLMLGAPCRADYASELLSLGPSAYWRLNEAGPVPPVILATNLGSLGAVGNGTYETVTRRQPGALAGDPSNFGVTLGNVNGGYGGSARVRIPWASELNGDGAFSVEFWAKPAVTSAIACPASSVDFNAATRYGWLFYQSDPGVANGNGWLFRLYHSSGNSLASVGISIDTNQWYHVVGTFDGAGTIKLYVNGALAATSAVEGTYTPNTARTDVPMTFGGRGDGVAGNYGWGGSMDEVAYYTAALNEATILAHYQAGTNTTPATAYESLVKSASPAVYLRLNEDNYAPLVAVNSGSRGTSANGAYGTTMAISAGMRPPTYPAMDTDNNAGTFNGVDSYVSCGTNASLAGTNDFTIMAWVKTTGITKGTVVQQRDVDGVVAGYNGEYVLSVNDDGTVQFMLYNGGYQFDYATTTTVNDGNWHQLAVVRKGLEAYTYVDGELSGSSSSTEIKSLVPLIATFIGRDMRDFITPFSGDIDEVALFETGLGQGSIRSLYYAAMGASTAPVMVTDPPVLEPATTIYTTTAFTITPDISGALPMSYVWRKDGVVVGTSRVFSKTAATLADAGSYSVTASNAFGTVTSASVTVSINPAEPASITQQPVARPVYLGGTAKLSVEASGTAPLTYQWKKAGVNIPGATGQTLIITNVTAVDAVAYSVGVSNVAGGVLSQNAAVTIRTPAANSYESAIVNAGPMTYWRLNETTGTTARDYVAGNDGQTVNSVTIGVAGPVPPAVPGLESGNTAFEFNGTDTAVAISSLGISGGLTACAWINPTALSGEQAIVGEDASWTMKLYNGEIRFTTPGILDHTSSGAPLTAGVWQQVAVTFNPSTTGGARFYVNGQLIGSLDASSLTKGSVAFYIGKNQWGQYFSGGIDEVAIYNRVLSADEIATIYATGAYGATTAPFITRQPGAQIAVAGNAVTLSVAAAGSLPLSYQWSKAGTPIPGATDSALTLAKVAFADAGNYAVTITNKAGSVTTKPAELTVLPEPTYANLTNDLVLHLRFDGTYDDSSSRGNNALAPNGNPAFTTGKVGQAVHIATTSGADYLQVTDNAQDFVFAETNSFTVSYWLKYTTAFNDSPIIGNAINSTYQLGWVFTEASGKVEYSLVSTANSGTYVANPVAGSPLINDGAWHNIVGVVDRDQQMALVYVDGAFAGSWSIEGLGTLDYGNAVTIGQDPTGAYGTATFDLDDVGIWRRALTGYDALSIYNAGATAAQSFDVVGPVKLKITSEGGNLVIAWQSGTLESTDNLSAASSWTAVAGASAPSYTVPAGTGKRFYRVRL